MGMPQAGQRAGLAEKAVQLTVGPRSMEHFDGRLGVQMPMLSQIDRSPVPLSQQLDELIVAQVLADAIGHLHTSSAQLHVTFALFFLLPTGKVLIVSVGPSSPGGGMLPSPRPDLCISRSIRLLGIAQGRLQVLMSQPLANGRQTHSTIDEFSRVRMPKLVERAGNPCLRAVMVPAFLHRLVAQRPSSPVLLRSEQWPMCVAHPFQVGAEKLYQMRIVEQDRPPFAAFSHDGEMFIVEREVEILHVQGEPLAHPQAGLQEQTGEESVPLTLSGNGFENAFN